MKKWNLNARKQFLDNLANKVGIKNPSDWGKVTVHDFRKNKGRTLLDEYGNSIKRILQDTFPDEDWKNDWFRKKRGYWITHQREFLDSVAKKLNINEPKQWGSISLEDIQGDGGYLLKIYGNSIQKALKANFPEIEWQSDWFSKSRKYWSNNKQKQFFDSLAQKLNIKKPEDWGSITTSVFLENGGRTIYSMYGGSFRRALKVIYPDIEWKTEWFYYKRRGYWTKLKQRQFIEDLLGKLNLKKLKDLESITNETVREYNGGRLLNIYGGSFRRALTSIYPDIHWNFPTKVQFNSLDAEKKFLLNIASKYSIREPRDWRKVTQSMITSNGGKPLLSKYFGSLQIALKSIFPEQEWTPLQTFFKTEDLLQHSLSTMLKDLIQSSKNKVENPKELKAKHLLYV